MEPWIRTLLSFLIISGGTYVWANSGEVKDAIVNNVTKDCCDPEKYKQLQDQLDILETAVRNIVSAIASQKKGPFAPINAILERDPALNAVLSPQDNVGAKISKESTVLLGEAKQSELEGNATIQLKRALKCSLAHLLDVNVSETTTSPSGKMKAVLNKNNSLEIEWVPPSLDCLKISSGIWVRVFESGNEQPNASTTEAYITIPQKCLKRRANTTYSFILHAPLSGFNGEKRCHFQLKNDLIPCQSYNVEVVPNYQSLKGKLLSTNIFVPPRGDSSSSTESLIGVTSHPDSLIFTWRDNTGCASQLTGLSLKIYPDGDEVAKLPIEIPRSCFEDVANETNSFSVHLSSNHSCPVKWEPLDACRRYKLEIQSLYWDAQTKASFWRGASTMWETFTTEQSYRTLVTSTTCKKDQFYCDGNCYENSWICDGTADCASGIDELHCDTECHDGFQCGPQCVPHEQVCNGEYDCLDGSDEMNSACEQMIEHSSMCYQIRNGSGHLSSQVTLPNDAVSSRIRFNRETHWSKWVFLISVQSNHQIWLSFNKFLTPEHHTLKVYDGLYSNSPLIMSHSGATRPPSVRSSSNHLYLEIPSFYHQSYGVEVFYTSMASTVEPFIPGCGGYVYRDGVIPYPNFLLLDAEITECVWYVEAGQSNRATALKQNFFLSNGTKLTSNKTDNQMDLHSTMIVSNGWDSSGKVLYDSRIASALQPRTVTYSISHKTTVRFVRSESQTNKDQENWNLSLNVSTMHIPEYAVVDMNGLSGTIKSPYFPVLPYEGNSDYRWNIHADSNSTIRLQFAFFDTQEGSDYIYVYDGPSVNSSLILEKTGTVSAPFTIHSSTNQILVRFVSDDDFTLHSGFLALYSAV
ncbi:uncharacterized protein LOC130689856 [Daphnia carinata]|uniref:uncharacterized protein LOC130689856 n=1 Tax=Daphnia carinata TaxID=120202 RepID=UPI00257EBFEB|nr:uncharacterized protein LOC130689856 [Daphnia carinata]